MMQRVADNSSAYVAGDYLMTDDKAPVELLGMQVIDQLIQEEVAYYKDIYEEQGISGLLPDPPYQREHARCWSCQVCTRSYRL